MPQIAMPRAPIATPERTRSAPVFEKIVRQRLVIQRLGQFAGPQQIVQKGPEAMLNERRHKRAENAGQPDRDGVGQGETDIADGNIEGRSADAVGHAQRNETAIASRGASASTWSRWG